MNSFHDKHQAPTQNTPDKYQGPIPTKEGVALLRERLPMLQNAVRILDNIVAVNYPVEVPAQANYAQDGYVQPAANIPPNALGSTAAFAGVDHA